MKQRFNLPHRLTGSREADRNNDTILTALNDLGQFIYFGAGVPTFTPVDSKGNTARALYVRTNGGAGSTLYVYEGAGWAAK